MKRVGIYSIFFMAGILATLLVLFLYSKNDIDLLSISKDYPVITKQELILVDKDGMKINLPVGTSLIFKSQYREEGTFLLKIVSSNLKSFEKTEKLRVYFQKVESDKKSGTSTH